jgi:hypothetical protein
MTLGSAEHLEDRATLRSPAHAPLAELVANAGRF